MAQRPTLSPRDTVLRPARPSDLDAIVAIEERSFPTPWSRAALNAYLGQDGFQVCLYENELVGYVLVGLQIPSLLHRLERLTMSFLGHPPPEETVGHVMNIAIHPAFRGHGLGRFLLRRGLRYLRGLGASRVELEVRVDNRQAIRLYESEGFCTKRLLKGYYQNGDDAYLMHAPLESAV